MSDLLFGAIFACDLVAAVLGLTVGGTRAGRAAALALLALGGTLAVALGGAVLAGAPAPSVDIASGLPLGHLQFGLDSLSAIFVILAGLLLVAASIFADGYLAPHTGERATGVHLAVLSGLAAAMVLVCTARDGVGFLMAWESIAWLSYLAVILEIDDRQVSRAAFQMLAVSELGTLAVVAALLALGGSGFGFAALAAQGQHLGDPAASLVFLAFVFGFGAKAGILPLQMWLPEAHPAAPSHVSALLSAVIVKLGVYGIIRFGLGMLPHPDAWWGPALIGVGTTTALVGILWALFQRDLKRVLAYSTIENVGIIVAALGLAETFRAAGLELLASLALVAALYHAVTHALAKGVLFLGSGAVDRATGTRDLERLGGLARRLPVTSITMLLAILSLAAVAPFAGYLSEWMILETFLQGFNLPDLASRMVVLAGGALLALTAASAMVVFARLYAIGFVGQPRSRGAAEATEGAQSMRLAGALLLGPALAIALLPTLVLPLVDRAAQGIVGPSVLAHLVPPLYGGHPGAYAPLVGLGATLLGGILPINGLVVIPAPGFSTINSPTYLAIAELLLLALAVGGVRAIRRLGGDRRAPVWAGGIPAFEARRQYTATAYANPMRLIFQPVLRSVGVARGSDLAATGGTGAIEYEQSVPPPLERVLYRPLLAGVDRLARAIKVVQSGDTNQYVAYIFVVVLLVLLLRLV